MKASEALRELAEKLFLNYFIMGIDVADVGMPSFDMLKSAGIVDKNISDLTALISDGYLERTKYNELLQQRDELREALILAEGLIDMASDQEWAKIRAAIKNTEK